MNAEEALLKRVLNPNLLVVTGSRLYGTERYDENGKCTSDTDIRGVTVPPWEYLTTRNFDQANIPNEQDGLIYSIGFFIKQLIACNPQYLELLFVPRGCIVAIDEVGEKLLSIRQLFVCKRFYKRIFGFGNSEFRKARMVELESNDRTKTEDEVVNDIRNVFSPTFGELAKEKMDDVLSILFSCHPRKEISSSHKVNGKRKVELAKYGYGTSSACHALRLVRQCEELLTSGTMTFPRPDKDQLSAIKHGKITLSEFEKVYLDALHSAEKAVCISKLPERPDEGKIRSFWENIVGQSLLTDVRLQSMRK